MKMRVDAHSHIIDPANFPLVPHAGYTPHSERELGTADDYREVLDRNGMTHALLVQPSCYGSDNAAMLDAIDNGAGRFRGIAVVNPASDEDEFARLANRGIAGVRFNMVQSDPGVLSRADIRTFFRRLAALDWCLQIFAPASIWAVHADRLAESGLKVIVDHWGMPDCREGADQPSFRKLLGAARRAGNWAVKLSAPYRVSRRHPEYDDLDPFADALIDAFGIRNCVWGSDWPYLNTPNEIEYDRLLASLNRWVPDPMEREMILWNNPARLFGFS